MYTQRKFLWYYTVMLVLFFDSGERRQATSLQSLQLAQVPGVASLNARLGRRGMSFDGNETFFFFQAMHNTTNH